MSDPSTIIAGSSVFSGLLGASASSDAASSQAESANQAARTQLQMFNTINDQQKPYRDAGYASLDSIMYGMGINGGSQGGAVTQNPTGVVPPKGVDLVPEGSQTPDSTPQATIGSIGSAPQNNVVAAQKRGIDMSALYGLDMGQGSSVYVPAITSGVQPPAQQAQQPQTVPQSVQSISANGNIGSGQFTHQFNADDLKTSLAPNYQFMLEQGQGAAKNSANAQTGLLSGNAMQGLERYTQDYAGNAYQQAYNNYNANQTNIFNRLSTIAGLGNSANQTSASAGTTAGQGIASSQIASGAAQAAGSVGVANSINGAINNGISMYTLNNMLNKNNTPITQWT